MNPKDCKYYNSCSCNVCPLDPEKDKRTIEARDKTKYCLLERNNKIASTMPQVENLELKVS